MTRNIAASGDNLGHPGEMAVVLDGTVYSVASVKQEIDSPDAVIEGYFSEREAFNLANVLNNPLDLPLIVKSQFEVGPSLAADAVTSGVRASIIALCLVVAFMVTFYTTGGLVAVATLGGQPRHHPRHHGEHRRDDDASRPRRHRAHDRHGGGREHPDLRAHEGGAGRRQVARRQPTRPATPRR